MTAIEIAAVLSPLCTVAVAYVGRARIAKVEERVDGHLDALNAELGDLRERLVAARLSPAERPPLDAPPAAE